MKLLEQLELRLVDGGLRLILKWLSRLAPERRMGGFGLILSWLSQLNSPHQIAIVRSSLPLLDANGRLETLRSLLAEPQSNNNFNQDLDAVVNFSAYQRDAWVRMKAKMVKPGARVLDAGAGQCQYQGLFDHTNYKAQDFAQYVGSDQGPLWESWNYGKLDYICDITAIPVPDGSFDVVLCTEVLEHVPDPLSTIRELVRVLAPGGTLLITAPLGSGIHQEPHHYYGGFSPYFFRRVFGELGVEPVAIKPLGGLLKHVAQEVARAGRTLAGSGELNAEAEHIVNQWLPQRLAELDDRYFVEQFTVGFLVEARKNA